MHFDDYRQYDATALARLVRDGEVSPAETVAAAAEGIERFNPTLNAVIESWADEARDTVARKTPTGPLAGVPFLFKDMVEWKGRAVTFGSRLLDGYLPLETHPLARRYAEAGLVPMGRTNMSELGLMPLTEPAFYGPTLNPWDHSRSPGGSSGGSAAAVAAGIVPVAHAADGGGSIRIPASACGLFGLKPTRGLTLEALHEVPAGFMSHHVVSRSVRDSALLLDLTSGPSPGSRWRPPHCPHSFVDATERDPEPLRVGFMRTDFLGQPVHPSCRRAVDDAAKLLGELGHEVEEVPPPFDGLDYRAAFSVLWAVGASFFVKQVRAELHTMDTLPAPVVRLLRLPGALEAALALAEKLGHPLVEPLTRRLARHSDTMSPADLWVVWQALNRATAAMGAFFEGYDLMLTSTLTEPPWKLGSYDGARASLESVEVDLFAYAGLTPIANTAGLPAMSVPLHREGDLPIGVQLLGPHAADATLLSLAAQLERARPWQSWTR